MDEPLDERAMSRLRWRCRRGLLENDLFIERFFERYGQGLTQAQGGALSELMELPDNDLLDLFFARSEPQGELDREPIRHVLGLLREGAAPRPMGHRDTTGTTP